MTIGVSWSRASAFAITPSLQHLSEIRSHASRHGQQVYHRHHRSRRIANCLSYDWSRNGPVGSSLAASIFGGSCLRRPQADPVSCHAIQRRCRSIRAPFAGASFSGAAATIYNVPETDRPGEEQVEQISIWELPKIFWAAVILFVVNLVVATGIAASPELDVDIRGEAAGSAVSAKSRPSAFVDPEPQRRRAVREAVKLQPVLEVQSAAYFEFK